MILVVMRSINTEKQKQFEIYGGKILMLWKKNDYLWTITIVINMNINFEFYRQKEITNLSQQHIKTKPINTKDKVYNKIKENWIKLP